MPGHYGKEENKNGMKKRKGKKANGKRKPNAFIQKAMKKFKEEKKKNPNYTYKQALKDTKK
jgi:hypothetical protein